MKKKELILDFTSLLDVTLIIIFFFVIFSHFDSVENKARVEKEVQKLETQNAQLEREIDMVRESSERRAQNVSGQLEFGRSENVKVLMTQKEGTPQATIKKGEELLTTFMLDGESSNCYESVKNALKEAGYDKGNTIFCEFIYNGDSPLSYHAYKKVRGALDKIQEEYKTFYISETNVETGEKYHEGNS